MKRQLILVSIVALMVVFTASSVAFARSSSKLRHEPDVVSRVIRIEGSVEKPRVIFIVPRSRLWRGGFLNKSFKEDILRPVYPDKLIKQWAQPLHKGG